jgi:hypothetical protein
VVHVNRGYVRKGPVDPAKLLTVSDQTAASAKHLAEVDKHLEEMFTVLKRDKVPDIEPGPHCTSPYECPFYDHCNRDPGVGSVEDLPYGKRVVAQLLAAGIRRLADIPHGKFRLSEAQQAMARSARSGKPDVDAQALRVFLKGLEYPLCYLDFETAASAIPLFDGTRPWQSLPFQVSLHVQARPGGPVKHHSFLAQGKEDPRPELCAAMLAGLGAKGTILAWNVGFERRIVREMGDALPAYRAKLARLDGRFIDLMEPFKKGWYADYRFRGSASLKSVVPVMVPQLAYDDLEIQGGDTASVRAERWFSGDMDEKEWRVQREHLLKYCERDTAVMVEIVEKLNKAAGK